MSQQPRTNTDVDHLGQIWLNSMHSYNSIFLALGEERRKGVLAVSFCCRMSIKAVNSTFCHTTHFLPLRQNNSFLLSCLYVLEVLSRFHWQLFNQSLCKVSCMVLNPIFLHWQNLIWQKIAICRQKMQCQRLWEKICHLNSLSLLGRKKNWTLLEGIQMTKIFTKPMTNTLSHLQMGIFCHINFCQHRKIGFWNFASQNQIKNYSLKTIDHLSIYHKNILTHI